MINWHHSQNVVLVVLKAKFRSCSRLSKLIVDFQHHRHEANYRNYKQKTKKQKKKKTAKLYQHF